VTSPTNLAPPEPRRVVILGSTGSIGRQALDVIRSHPDRFEVIALVAGSDEAALKAQAREFGVADTGLGASAAAELAALDDADVVLNAVVGAAGLRASVAALSAGTTLALANKESLIAGGEACKEAAATTGAAIVPVDSEHFALMQAATGHSGYSSMVITASGGPFRTRSDLKDVTPTEALAHPTWSMGPKITIDSATLMNKGLEVIEAHHLFGLAYDDIEVVVHPQSIVHGMVRFPDGTVLMQAAPTDMKIPINAALAWPEAPSPLGHRLNLTEIDSLTFEQVDRARFPSLDLAYGAGRAGGTAPAVLNAANEVAVHAFLDGGLDFPGIPRTVEAVLSSHTVVSADDVEAILEADAWAREEATRLIGSGSKAGVST
jgi:1-deoxy-D-xylulose-5-phosphate reductoisomerase